MDSISMLGYVAALCTSCAFVPQVVQILRSGNVDGISLHMYSVFTLGVGLWLTYGYILGDMPMMLANLVTFILAAMVLGLTVHKRIQQRRRESQKQRI